MGVINNLNFIKQAWVFPCQSPGILIEIQTGLEAGALTLIEFISFGCNDILQARAGKFPICGRGVSIHAKQMFPGLNVSKVEKVFKILEPIEKGLFWWMVADLATGFLANWTSLIYQSIECPGVQHDTKIVAEDGRGYGVGPNTIYRATYRQTSSSGPGRYFVGHGFLVPEDFYWSCSFTLETHPFLGRPRPGITMFLQQNGGHVLEMEPCNNQLNLWINGSRGHCRRTGRAPHGRQYSFYEFRYEMDGWGIASGGSAHLIVSQFPIVSNDLEPLSCFGRNVSLGDFGADGEPLIPIGL